MEHVEKNYAVVGILEEMNKTLTVLEHYVPRFFKGALNTYWGEYLMVYVIMKQNEKDTSIRISK